MKYTFIVNTFYYRGFSMPGTDWVDPEDPTVIAENELLTAAKSIEAAAMKLSQLRPRQMKVSITLF